MKTMTLDKFLADRNITPKCWRYASTSEDVILQFTTANKAYTLLPEYLAKSAAECGDCIKDMVRYCRRIAKDFNLDNARFLQLVLDKTVELANKELNETK